MSETYRPCDLCPAPALWNLQAESWASACGRHLHKVALDVHKQGSDLRMLLDYLPSERDL